MDFLTETFDKAKEWMLLAKEKGEVAVNVGKQKIEVATLENKLNKLYARLGKSVLGMLEDAEELPPGVNAIIKEINEVKYALEKSKNGEL